MKTLKQIREEYNSNKESVEYIVEAEDRDERGGRLKSIIPSNREMPSMLMFRRITFRVFPKKQVVALYYSKLIDKYLSVPFGPGGNLNLSESVFHDTIEEAIAFNEDFVSDGMSAAGAVAGTAVGGPVGGAVGGALGKVGGWIAKKVLGGKKGDANNSNQSSSDDTMKKVGGFKYNRSMAKTGSAKSKGSANATADSKLRQADLNRAKEVNSAKTSQQQVAENKISDIRKMVSEGTESFDIAINGRQVTLNTSMAKRILEVYDSVNTKNKKIVEGMLNEDMESFKKLLNFSIRN